jgi:hypothetical protein
VLQQGEVETATASVPSVVGTKTWTSSNPTVLAVNSSSGALTLGTVTANTTVTISYVNDAPYTAGSATITVYKAAETLAPSYGSFSDVYGATLQPSNASAINTAKGSNTISFSRVSGTAATVNSSTGELTLLSSGSVTVSLRIRNSSGVVTHKGTSASVIVSQKTPGGISVVFSGVPADETITVSSQGQALEISWNNNSSLSLSVSGFSAYQWYVDGTALSGKTSGSLVLSGADYSIGNHFVTVRVTSGGRQYTKTALFKVVL